MVTAGTLSEAQRAVAFCREWNTRLGANKLFTTVGVHPTRANEWKSDPTNYMAGLEQVLREDAVAPGASVVVAIGECGLDYDRLEFCDKETQMACFREHFRLAETYNLPMFLHSRATGGGHGGGAQGECVGHGQGGRGAFVRWFCRGDGGAAFDCVR